MSAQHLVPPSDLFLELARRDTSRSAPSLRECGAGQRQIVRRAEFREALDGLREMRVPHRIVSRQVAADLVVRAALLVGELQPLGGREALAPGGVRLCALVTQPVIPALQQPRRRLAEWKQAGEAAQRLEGLPRA